jgi:hypothetical protein
MINVPKNIMTYTKIPRPNVVKVIKKRPPPTGERSIWCSPEYRDKMYSSMFNEKQFIYSFLTHEPSIKCIQFLNKYKQVNGHYPDLHGKHIKRKNDNGELYIGYENLKDLKKKCLLNGVGLIGISDFGYTYIDSFLGQKNVFNLNISAIDLLEDEVLDHNEQIENFNYLLDF